VEKPDAFYSSNPVFLAYAERLTEGLRKAGLPE
jgi:hypothetical protein